MKESSPNLERPNEVIGQMSEEIVKLGKKQLQEGLTYDLAALLFIKRAYEVAEEYTQILREDEVVWSYSTHQSGQTVYKSEWIELSRGSYKFTYATAGLGSFDAKIRVVTKGGFW